MIDKGLILGLLIFFPRQQFGAGVRAAVCGHSEPHRASCVLLDTFLPSSRLWGCIFISREVSRDTIHAVTYTHLAQMHITQICPRA